MEQLNDSIEQPFGYIEIQSASGTLTDEQYQECLKDSAIIKYGQNIYVKYNTENNIISFKQINDISFNSTDSLCETYDYYIQVKSDKTYLLTCKANQVYILQQLDTLLLDEMSAYKTVTVELTQTASKAYAVGDILIYNNTPYKVTSAIASGGNIIVGTNVVKATTEEIFKYLEEEWEITMEDGTNFTKLFLVEA